MEVTFTLKLIDHLTAPAKAAKEALQGLVKAAGDAAKDGTKTAVDKVRQAGADTRDLARTSAEATARIVREPASKAPASLEKPTAAATARARVKADEAAEAAKEVAKGPSAAVASPRTSQQASPPQTPITQASARARAAAERVANVAIAAGKPLAPSDPLSAKPRRRIIDFLRDVGDAPQPEQPTPAAPKPAASKGSGQKLGIADLPDDATGGGDKTGGLVGRSVGMVKQRVAAAVTQSLGDKLFDVANTAIAGKLDSILSPLHTQMDGLKEQFPALTPHIDMVRERIDGLAMTLSGMATNVAGRAASSIASRVGSMAAGLIGWPGLLVAGAGLVLANWTKVKAFFSNLFGKLPEPVQAAMSRIGAILSTTPLGSLARGFDQIASYVEKVFDAIVNGGEQRWTRLKQMLLDNPMQWISGAWDGLKSYFSNLWNDLKANPRQALAGMASAVASEFKKIPLALAGVGISIIEAITGADLSGVRSAVENIINAFYDIPSRLIDLGGKIIDQIKSGDWTGAATTLATSFVDGLRTILTSLGTLGNEIVKAIAGVDIGTEASKLADRFVEAIKGIPGQLGGLVDDIKNAFKIDLSDIGEKIMSSLLDGLKKGFGAVIAWLSSKAAEIKNKVADMMPTMPSWLGGGGGAKTSPSTPAIPGRARGGPVQAGGLYKVGEEGEELFVPNQDGQIINANDTRRLLMPANLPPSAPAPSLFGAAGGGAAGSTTVRMEGGRTNSTVNHFQISVSGGQTDDPETFARRMWAEIERSTRGSLNDGVDK